jgi:hypothetical protein
MQQLLVQAETSRTLLQTENDVETILAMISGIRSLNTQQIDIVKLFNVFGLDHIPPTSKVLTILLQSIPAAFL